MARPKKLVIESVEQNENETGLQTVNSSITDFELTAEIAAGTLTSNAKELKAKIESELKNYSVEKYIDNPDAAKTDKALLNKVKDSVASKRKEITQAWNKPLDEFLYEMKSLETAISDASEKINEIVKEADAKEKAEKKQQIERYWSTLEFTLIPLEKIFNPKWLNKGYKMDQIMLDCEAAIEKISSELSTIRTMGGEDNEILQSFYLETLDLNATLQKGNQLKANKEKLKAVEPEKPSIVTTTTVGSMEHNEKTGNKSILVVGDEIKTFTLKLFGTKEQLVALRKYIDASGIKYKKLG